MANRWQSDIFMTLTASGTVRGPYCDTRLHDELAARRGSQKRPPQATAMNGRAAAHENEFEAALGGEEPGFAEF